MSVLLIVLSLIVPVLLGGFYWRTLRRSRSPAPIALLDSHREGIVNRLEKMAWRPLLRESLIQYQSELAAQAVAKRRYPAASPPANPKPVISSLSPRWGASAVTHSSIPDLPSCPLLNDIDLVKKVSRRRRGLEILVNVKPKKSPENPQ